jgi:hypothetical protein
MSTDCQLNVFLASRKSIYFYRNNSIGIEITIYKLVRLKCSARVGMLRTTFRVASTST